MKRVLVADDYPRVRQGIRRLFASEPGWDVVAEAADGVEAVRLALECKPDLVVIDVSMPGLSGIEATRQIARALPSTRILILSIYDEEPYVAEAFEAGVNGYVLKEAADCDLTRAAMEVMDGRRFISRLITVEPKPIYAAPEGSW
jgi:DNA-binding NarL/FixJ family response regulator